MAKVVYISELDQSGSGYTNITANLCAGLTKAGHQVMILAINYQGQEHLLPCSVIPMASFPEASAALHNLYHMPDVPPNYDTRPDVVIVAIDIPYHMQFLKAIQDLPIPYIGIMPLESGPLCMTWAMSLGGMRKIFMISQHATDAVTDAGLEAEHLRLGLDTTFWKIPTAEERSQARLGLLGLEEADDTFVIFVNADNQERKNLSAALEIVADVRKKVQRKMKLVMLTRPSNHMGWRLGDLAQKLGIADIYVEFNRGMPPQNVWSLYAASDALLLTSKAEGLAYPILEAMAVGVPVIATDTGAITEHIREGSGRLIPKKFEFTDPYGNGTRGFIDVKKAAKALETLINNPKDDLSIAKARGYAESRLWSIPVIQLDRAIREIVENKNGKETQEQPELS